MRRLAYLVAVLACGTANAQYDRSFSPHLFHPAPGPDEFVTVETAVPLPHKAPGFGLFFNYAHDEILIEGVNSATGKPDGSHANFLANSLSMDLWAAIGIANRLQIAVALPMVLFQNGTDFNDANPMPTGTHVKAANGFALGDPRLHLKLRFYGHDRGPQVGLSAYVSFPVGNDAQLGGEKHFSGFAGEPRLLMGWEANRWRTGLFLGFLWRAHTSELFSTVAGQQLTYGGAFAFDAVVGRLTLVAELYGHSQSFNSFKGFLGVVKDANDTPLEIDLAAKIIVWINLSLTVGVGYGLLPAVGDPSPRVFLGLTYARSAHDKDKDGIPDNVDKCPDDPEDKDGYKDWDGCPDPDNDSDTLLDKQDKCPNEPEDFDGFQDDDGCPDPDNDKDGIDDLHDACPNDPEDHKPPKPDDGCPVSKTDTDGDGIMDDKDKCPTEPEDKDGFQDEDGCPDPDNDNDGIPDNFDTCPNEPEDMDGFQDEDGCPDPDNDKDGIPDKLDKCPNEPETINGYQDEDGCPDKGPPAKVKIDVEHKQIVILDKIFFDTDKATIKPVSFGLLDQVAQVLRGHDELKIRIEGHTDSQGKEQHNMQLSQERADSVRTYLIKKGIDPKRLVAVGYGPTVPIANNKTKAGREANRRVEFHIVEEPKKKPADEGDKGEDKGNDAGGDKANP